MCASSSSSFPPVDSINCQSSFPLVHSTIVFPPHSVRATNLTADFLEGERLHVLKYEVCVSLLYWFLLV